MQAATQAAGNERRLREYETIYILRPDADPDTAAQISDRITDIIARLGGKLLRADVWGKRRLAYVIRKHTRGIFIYARYVGFNDLVAEIERNLRLLEPVMRHQTVLLNAEVDLASINVDPEEAKFARLEVTEDEPEPDAAERLGMREQPRRDMRDDMGMDMGPEGEFTAEDDDGQPAPRREVDE
jgi:small subunit ribosomal protein S6